MPKHNPGVLESHMAADEPTLVTYGELDELQALCDAATPGPHIAVGYCIYGPNHPESRHPNGRIFLARTAEGSNRRDPMLDGGASPNISGDGKSDAELYARARNAIPRLIAEVRMGRAKGR